MISTPVSRRTLLPEPHIPRHFLTDMGVYHRPPIGGERHYVQQQRQKTRGPGHYEPQRPHLAAPGLDWVGHTVETAGDRTPRVVIATGSGLDSWDSACMRPGSSRRPGVGGISGRGRTLSSRFSGYDISSGACVPVLVVGVCLVGAVSRCWICRRSGSRGTTPAWEA